MTTIASIVVSGAPGTGKSTVADRLAADLHLPELSLDAIKETLADVLGCGDETWSNRLGDAAAEVIFRLSKTFDRCVVEGWWRKARRDRAVVQFDGFIEVFCHCDPALALERFARRQKTSRHPIHRDVINPSMVERVGTLAATVIPLGVGPLIPLDTSSEIDWPALTRQLAAAGEQRH